jgi:sugar lactone lactonase YvrE
MNWSASASFFRRFFLCLFVPLVAACSFGVISEAEYYSAKGVPTSVSIDRSKLCLSIDDAPIHLRASAGSSSSGNVALVWSSSDASVASVDSTGLVTPVSVGNATITAASDSISRDYAHASCVVTVTTTKTVYYHGTAASFYSPQGVAVDSSGNVYVADTNNNKIRKCTSAGVVTTYAVAIDGTGTGACFDAPGGVAVDASGNVYVADSGNNKIRKLTSAGVGTTLAGSGAYGGADGSGASASFKNPTGVAVDSSGNVYVADSGNNKIRKIDSSGVVSTFADSTAGFNNPASVAVDSSGNVYVADSSNHKIRKIDSAGQVTTLAGSGSAGSADGSGTAAGFYYPRGVAVDSSGNVYVADTDSNKIRKIDSAGKVTTLAGSEASFKNPTGVAVDSSGNVYVADTNNNRIRKIDGSGVVSTLTGNGSSYYSDGVSVTGALSSFIGFTMDSSGTMYMIDDYKIVKITSNFTASILAGSDTFGHVDGSGTSARFYSPEGIAIDSARNLYVTDCTEIRKVTPSGTVSTLAGGFSRLLGIAVDGSGTVYVADVNARKILKVSASGSVSTLAGSGNSHSTDGSASSASFNTPQGIAVDGAGNVYVTDDNFIRKIDTSGTVTTIAGSVYSGSTDGIGTAASFKAPNGIIVDSSGNLFVQDYHGVYLRMITPDGTVSTVCSICSYTSDSHPSSLFLSNSGILYAADTSGNTIYQLETRRIK